MKKIYFMATFIALATFGGCSTTIDGSDDINLAKSEISIGLPIGINRTVVDAEGKAAWVEGDSFSLWAENRTGAFVHNGVDFKMMYYWHSLQSAVFTSNANSLAEGNYTYYAVSPKPESIDGRKATYTLPAVQQGDSFNGAYDIMVAEPVVAEALSADKVNNLALDFQHKTHLLKMTIAENNFGRSVSKLQLEFPSAVTGNVVVDVTKPNENPVISSGNNTLTLNLDKAADVGDTIYGVVVPGTMNGNVKLTAISPLGQLSEVRTFQLSKELKAGHITPMSLVIPEVYRKTAIRFSIGTNHLGEAIQKLTIIDNNGATIATFNTNSSNRYEMYHEGNIANSKYESYSNKTFTARFESAHAIVEQKFTMPTITAYTTTTVPAITVPYLLFEDFSQAKGYADHDNFTASANNETGEHPGFLLNNYMPTNGWNASRFKIEAGQSIRINVRYQSGAWVVERICGRLDTPAMKGLKSGAKVTLKVTFDTGFYVPKGYNYDDSGSTYSFFKIGTHTESESSKIDGDTQGDIDRRCSVAHTSNNYASEFGASSFSSVFPTVSYNIGNCTSSTRIVWWPCTNRDTSHIAANCCYFMYIDNIRVSIAQ